MSLPRRKPANPPNRFVMPPPSGRTRVGLGKQMFLCEDQVDERSAPARRFREIAAQLVIDLGNDLPEAKLQLVRRAASLCVWAEIVEAQLAKGEAVDIGEYTTASNSLRRLLADLGLERKASDALTIDAYLASKGYATTADEIDAG